MILYLVKDRSNLYNLHIKYIDVLYNFVMHVDPWPIIKNNRKQTEHKQLLKSIKLLGFIDDL